MPVKPKRKRVSLSGWRDDFENMPKKGRFQVLQFKGEVFQHDDGRVIDPVTGRMFTPYAWRKAR